MPEPSGSRSSRTPDPRDVPLGTGLADRAKNAIEGRRRGNVMDAVEEMERGNRAPTAPSTREPAGETEAARLRRQRAAQSTDNSQ